MLPSCYRSDASRSGAVRRSGVFRLVRRLADAHWSYLIASWPFGPRGARGRRRLRPRRKRLESSGALLLEQAGGASAARSSRCTGRLASGFCRSHLSPAEAVVCRRDRDRAAPRCEAGFVFRGHRGASSAEPRSSARAVVRASRRWTVPSSTTCKSCRGSRIAFGAGSRYKARELVGVGRHPRPGQSCRGRRGQPCVQGSRRGRWASGSA